jgi:uncharacterized protein (TIGR03437 family)
VRNLIVLTSLFAAPFLAQAQTAPAPVTCTAATLNGTYSLVLTGRNIPPAGGLSKEYTAVGNITFDGVGSVTATVAANTNSTPGLTQTMSGTYTVPSNCIGNITITTGGTATFTLIPYNKGANFTLTGQDGGYQYTGTGNPQPASCPTSTLSGSYVFNGGGFALATGAITGVNYISGLLQFDGAGSVTGNWTLTTTAPGTSDTISGHYTAAASGCIGSATLTDPSGAAYTLNYVITSANGANMSGIVANLAEAFTITAHSVFTNPGLAVANAAGVTTGTPPGSLFSVYGSGLANTTTQPGGATYPTTLSNVTVTVNTEAVPLSYISPTQINAQMPWDVVPGVATVVVKNGTTQTNSVAVVVPSTAAPGVFVYGANRGVVQNYPSYTLNSAAAPAPAGSTIIVYFTGGGPLQGGSSLVSGTAIKGALPITENASVMIAGTPATISYIGTTPGFVSLYQANVVIPKIAAGDHNMVLTINGTDSNTTVISTK